VGTLIVNSDGTYTFAPVANFNGPVPIATYTITNGTNTDTANINITITPVNDNPVAVPDIVSVTEDNILHGDLGGNDTQSGDGGNVWSLVTGPTHGTVIVNLDGTYTYTPDGSYNGPDSFTYRLCDGDGSCSTAIVSITVNPANDAPVAANDIATTPEDTPISGNVLTNDTDTEGTALTVTQFVVNGDPATYLAGQTATISLVGTIKIESDGTFTFSPYANYYGPVPTVTYTNSDGSLTDTATLDITVIPVNDAPVAADDSYTTAEDVPLTGNLALNDTRSGDGSNVWSVVTNPLHGTVIINLDGTFTYTPTGNYTGPDSFTYKLCDADPDLTT
jgi:VCBS repeat-containing protein